MVAALVLAAVAVPMLRSGARARSAARLAREALAARRFEEARDLIGRWDALAPRDGEPAYYRALLEVEADRPAEAIDAIRRSVARGYPAGPLEVLRAILMARAGRLDEAEPVLARAFQGGDGPRVEVAEALARIYLKTFRLAEAARALDAWTLAAPDDPRPFLLRNEVDERVESGPAAPIRNYREALRRDPGRLDARLGLAEKLREASMLDEAEAEYATLLGRAPRDLRGRVGAGRVALLKGDVQAAARHFAEALAIDPRDKVALRESGLIDLNAGRVEQACVRLKAAVEVDPHDPEVRYSYARALGRSGDAPRAAAEDAATERLRGEQRRITDLRRRLVGRPDDVDLRGEAARWLIEHGHEKEGLEWTELILRRHPGHPPTCRLLADYHAARGDHGLANYYRLAASTAAGPN